VLFYQNLERGKPLLLKGEKRTHSDSEGGSLLSGGSENAIFRAPDNVITITQREAISETVRESDNCSWSSRSNSPSAENHM